MNWTKPTPQKKAAVLIVLLLFTFFIGRYTVPRAIPGESAVSTAAGVAQDRLYTCSMHPQIRSPDPKGKCPICGMDLIPVAGDDDHDADDGPTVQLKLSKRALALLDIQTFPAERRSVNHELRVFGRLEHDERRLITISAWVAGRLDELLVNFVGHRIEKDQAIAKIYSPGLIAAQQELLAAKGVAARAQDRSAAAGSFGHSTLDAAREKLRQLGLSTQQIQAIEQNHRIEEHTLIQAPAGGTVIDRHVTAGEYVTVGDPLYSISDLAQLWVKFAVFESDISPIRVGQSVQFSTQALPGEVFSGTVEFIQPVLDSRTRSVEVRAAIDNSRQLLKPGMLVLGTITAVIADKAGELPLVIPASAPLITGERALVYVRVPDHERPVFAPRTVILGLRAGDYYVVRSGLREGELVVTNGSFKIDSELQIRGRPSMMQPEGGAIQAHQHNGAARQHSHAAAALAATHFPAVDPAVTTEMRNLLAAYLRHTEALAADDFQSAWQALHDLQAVLLKIEVDLLSPEAGRWWEEKSAALQELLHPLPGVRDLAQLRTPLPQLTALVAQIARQFIDTYETRIVRAHCPMVNDNQGADWLQKGDVIANPYFGADMLLCGAIEEVLFGGAAQ